MRFLCRRSPSESVVQLELGRFAMLSEIGSADRVDSVGMKLLDVHDGDGSEDGDVERGCSKGRCQLFVSKNWTEIVWIYGGIVAASLLRVDVPLSSQSVRFGSESAGAEMDDEVELR